MTIHATLLNQLEAFEERFGVKVVPRRSGWHLKLDDPDGDGGFFEWWLDDREIMIVDSHDAHAHIREGARKAVEWWCKRGKWTLHYVFHDDDSITLSANDYTLGTGPTTEDALSGAMATILKEKAE